MPTGTDDKPNDTPPQENADETPADFETWLGGQPEPIKALVTGHFDTSTKGLKSALDGERSEKKDLAKQVRELSEKLTKDSDERKGLEELAGRMEVATKRADFYEAASMAGVTNLKLAWLAMQEAELVDRHGKPDFDAMREQFPELFKETKKVPPDGNAGAGTKDKPPIAGGMNDFIRAAAGHSK